MEKILLTVKRKICLPQVEKICLPRKEKTVYLTGKILLDIQKYVILYCRPVSMCTVLSYLLHFIKQLITHYPGNSIWKDYVIILI